VKAATDMNTNGGKEELAIGAHIFRFEPPDLFVIDLIGDVSQGDMAAIGEGLRRATGPFLIIINAKKMGSFSADAKKAIRDIPMSAGIAVVGASQATKLVLSILNRVYIMVNFGSDNPVEFCETEAQARKWVDTRWREMKNMA
jgi:hypothetical protein